MVKLLYGVPGTGKSRVLIDSANSIANDSSEEKAAFITNDKNKMCEINYRVRFVDVKSYDVDKPCDFIGFLKGLLAYDYDIKHIYIDNLSKILAGSDFVAEDVLKGLDTVSSKFDLDILVSMTGDAEIPEALKAYI